MEFEKSSAQFPKASTREKYDLINSLKDKLLKLEEELEHFKVSVKKFLLGTQNFDEILSSNKMLKYRYVIGFVEDYTTPSDATSKFFKPMADDPNMKLVISTPNGKFQVVTQPSKVNTSPSMVITREIYFNDEPISHNKHDICRQKLFFDKKKFG